MITLIFLGIILFIVAETVIKRNPQTFKLVTPIKISGLVLVVIGVLSSCIVQIEAGEVGVMTLFGKVQSGKLNSGLNLINPASDVIRFNVKTQNYTMSGVHSEGEIEGDDAISVLSADGLEVKIDLTILFRVNEDKASFIFETLGLDYKNSVVRAVTRTKIRDNAVYYNAVDLYSTKRDAFQARVTKGIEMEFAKRGLILESVLVRNIDLPKSVKSTIESKINAEQESQKMQFVLTKEKQEAERKRVEAQGIADYQKIISAELSDKQLRYEQIKAYKELANSSNTKVLIMNGNQPVILNGN
jgi:regulator of protease activity HflC (stomatin/prohibitin superfamily)